MKSFGLLVGLGDALLYRGALDQLKGRPGCEIIDISFFKYYVNKYR